MVPVLLPARLPRTTSSSPGSRSLTRPSVSVIYPVDNTEVDDTCTGLVDKVSQGLLTAPMSGIMGLAFANLAASNSTPFWQTLVQTSGVLDSQLFAIQITRFLNDTNPNANQLQPGGSFSIGTLDSSLFTGNIDYQDIPDTNSGFWLQQLACKTLTHP